MTLPMPLKRRLRTRVNGLLTGATAQKLLRLSHAVRRRLRGATPEVYYFHQVDDPYSDLAVRALPHLETTYAIRMIGCLVPAPDKGAAPEPERLMQWSMRDARDLANALGLEPAPWDKAPDAETLARAQAAMAGARDVSTFVTTAARIREIFSGRQVSAPDQAGSSETGDIKTVLADGAALRHRLGHYLGATFYFEGEWYWGLDRLPYLEQRLIDQGLLKVVPVQHSHKMFVDRLEAMTPGKPSVSSSHLRQRTGKRQPRIDLYLSFRSPYSWIALPRVIALADHYQAELHLRFVLPMVMRGLPIPESKRRYIVTDTKREANRVGLPFGLIADPVGKPTERGLAVLHHAIALGKGEAFALSFMRGVFAEGIDARSDRGLFKLCTRAGISQAQMLAALADTSWRAVAEANREEMFAHGIWGVPAFRVNGGSAHWGQDRLWRLEQLLQSASASD